MCVEGWRWEREENCQKRGQGGWAGYPIRGSNHDSYLMADWLLIAKRDVTAKNKMWLQLV